MSFFHIQATADVKTTAGDAYAPQPHLIVRTSNKKIKDAFFVLERKPYTQTIKCEIMVPLLFSTFYVFNIKYTPGCTNFYTLLEVFS